MAFVLIARKLAAEAAESAEMCSEFDRVSALLAISAANSVQNVNPVRSGDCVIAERPMGCGGQSIMEVGQMEECREVAPPARSISGGSSMFADSPWIRSRVFSKALLLPLVSRPCCPADSKS